MQNEQQELLPIEEVTAISETDRWTLFQRVGLVFRPSVPVNERDVFAGRDDQITRICDVILQPGQHAILFGERGVGKTSLANVISQYLVPTEEEERAGKPIVSPRVNCDGEDTFDTVWRKILGRVTLSREYRPLGFVAESAHEGVSGIELTDAVYWADQYNRLTLNPDAVLSALGRLGANSVPILVVDEFDRLPPVPRKAFADLIKMLSDHNVPATIVLVGVSESVDALLGDHESVGRALVQVKMPRMSSAEIQSILRRGLGQLKMSIEETALRRITAISQGLPHYAHLLGQHAARAAIAKSSMVVTASNVRDAVCSAAEDAQQSVQRAYQDAIRSPQKGNLFADVLLACSMATCDELGYFKAADVRGPMCEITGKDYDIPNFSQHLSEFASAKRGNILQVIGEKRRKSYHFRDPLIQPYVIMQGEISSRLPPGFYDRAID